MHPAKYAISPEYRKFLLSGNCKKNHLDTYVYVCTYLMRFHFKFIKYQFNPVSRCC